MLLFLYGLLNRVDPLCNASLLFVDVHIIGVGGSDYFPLCYSGSNGVEDVTNLVSACFSYIISLRVYNVYVTAHAFSSIPCSMFREGLILGTLNVGSGGRHSFFTKTISRFNVFIILNWSECLSLNWKILV
jgi:hypothetical protein